MLLGCVQITIMVNFKKKLQKAQLSKATDPKDIYATLDRTGAAGPTLRPSQDVVLSDWYTNHRDDKDVIIKLHTGEGKTLVGLLLLQSKLNLGEGPCLYVAPNKQLAQQVTKDADKFGIKYETIPQDINMLPIDFKSGKKMLITYVQKVFNGRTIFGLDRNSTDVKTVLLDDSHACIESIRSSFTLRIKRDTSLFENLLNIFHDDLKHQGPGDFLQIQKSSRSSALLQIPYWAWYDKLEEVQTLIYNYVTDTEDASVYFAWPLLQNSLDVCSAFVTSAGIEIVPDCSMIQRFNCFTEAKQRVMMSATTQDDSFFIKGLGISKEAVLSPLTNKRNRWSGEKMILFPSLIDGELNSPAIREWVCGLRMSGVVILVPSFAHTSYYESMDCVIANNTNMEAVLTGLSNKSINHPVVFVNRYDGVDLADDRCRLLIIDSLPYFDSLSDRYEQSCREFSDQIYTKIAQKVEQGIGRSVRSEKDYSAIIIIEEELVHFVKSVKSQRFFSRQTAKQIEIGDDVTESVKDEMSGESPWKAFGGVIAQCLKRDESWKQYYDEQMGLMEVDEEDHPYLEVILKEFQAECALYKKDFKKAVDLYQDIVNQNSANLQEKGWYQQMLAKCMWHVQRTEYEKIQSKAHDNNNYLLMPNDAPYKKRGFMQVSSIEQIIRRIQSFDEYFEYKISVESILSYLTIGVSANKFERALQDLGNLLGFESTRPDKQYKSGPDNLWHYSNNHYLLFECKSEKMQNSTEITKDEIGQMSNHIAWFKDNYGKDEAVKYIFIHPVSNISKLADIDNEIYALTSDGLDKLKTNVRGFVQEFERTDFQSISNEQVQNALKAYKLDIKSLEGDTYLKKCSK